MDYLLLKKKNRCAICKNEDCNQAGDKYVPYMNCSSYKAEAGGLSNREIEAQKEKEKWEKASQRSGGGIWPYLPDYDYDDDYDELLWLLSGERNGRKK